MTLRSIVRNYSTDNSGHFAVVTAIIALPMLLGVSIALDSHRMGRDHTHLKSAVDSAVIAAITDQTLTASERSAYAKDRFWSNMQKKDGITLEVQKADSYRVELEARMEVPTLFQVLLVRMSLISGHQQRLNW